MRVDFKVSGAERVEELLKQIEEKRMELYNLCNELSWCFAKIDMEIKEQPQEAAAQSYSQFISNPENLDPVKTALDLK